MKSTANLIEKLKRPLRPHYYYLQFLAKALRQSFAERRDKKTSDGALPVPPPLLRYRVHGSLDSDGYLEVGSLCARDIQDLLGLIDREVYSFNHVLDFGCGSGRVMRYFHERPASCHLHGTDIDKQAIAWCRKHLRFAQWDTNGFMPPTKYADHTFDFIRSFRFHPPE